MKMYHYLLGMLLLAGFANNASAQVSNDNEDGVYKIDSHFSHDYVPGQVLFKLKDGQQAQVRRVGGMVQSAGINSLDVVLKEYAVQEMEQLLPHATVSNTPRRAKAFNGDVIVERDLTQLYRIFLPEERADKTFELIEQLRKLDEVEYAEPNYRVYVMGTTNLSNLTNSDAAVIANNYSSNPMVNQQWYLDAYGVKELWNKPIINKTRPVIAIIDTGVDITHPDLKDNLWTNQAEADGRDDYDNDRNGFKNDVHGWDFINNTAKMRDNNMHGTHVAGIAAAANNGVGIIGANPKALIMPITVLQSDGTGDVATIVKGINYAVKNGANVLNLSLGTYVNSNAMRQALEQAYQSTVIVAAAGNDGKCIYVSHAKDHQPISPMPSFPGAYSFVLGVQATTPSGSLASFSNYDDDGPSTSCESSAQDPDGFNYELKAPGTKILSSIPGGRYKELQGTSMATPLAAGAISALMMVKQYDNQEILWGDLLHSDNIIGAYNVTNRPAELDVMRIMLHDRRELSNESENDFSDDQEIDAGETVSIYPVVRTSFGKASNIRLRIEAEYPLEVVTEEADFGFCLDAYGRAVSKNPLVIKVPNEMTNATRLNIRIIATCNESDKPFDFPFKLKVNNMWTIKGLITEDRTLTSDHVYYVSSSIGINEGATLTIEPGTRLEFAEDAGLYSFGKLIANGTPANPIIFTGHEGERVWNGIYSYTNDSISYCRMDGFVRDASLNYNLEPYLSDCVVKPLRNPYTYTSGYFVSGVRNILSDIELYRAANWNINLLYSNIINCNGVAADYTKLASNNFFNVYNDNGYFLRLLSDELIVYKADKPSYLGSAREDLLRPHIFERGNSSGMDGYGWKTYGTIDLSNMLKEPLKEAHGIVWKVLVNGKDVQDEQEELAPLGVGKHKFEVYFNRPMNKAVTPQISFGVISPYNQHPVSEDGSWNDEGTIYTAYVTIDGKTQSDGMNRIYVHDAEDNEFFPCPYEATRFNIMVQAVGSMASGFQADAGLGCVNLTWNNENNEFEDAMGFNVYRYTQGDDGVNDTIRINESILDISATSYIDDNVTPGQTYYYYYKVLSTALQEYDVSNVVAATPLTATRGDANGSGEVDVADVVTTVNYITGMEPKPFVFDAADMNTDKLIDIFDVVGIIRGILNPTLLVSSLSEEAATYTVEDGTLYVDSPVALGGVQVQLTLVDSSKKDDISVASDLDGFETASAWQTDNDFLFLAYSMNGKTLAPGKHALLHIGEAEISSLRLSDAQGKNVSVNAGETTGIDRMGKHVMNINGIYDMQGRKLSPRTSLKKGIYIINGEKVVK